MAARASPRDRLIDTAADLFYARGLPNVGVNEVTERAGDVGPSTPRTAQGPARRSAKRAMVLR